MALPPNWTRYTTDEGKEYFHNSATNVTQWEPPAWPPGTSGPDTDVFTYKPTEMELQAPTVSAGDFGGPAPQAVGSSPQSVSSFVDSELVSLTAAPSGVMGSGDSKGSGAMAGGDGMAAGGTAAASSSEQTWGIPSWVLSSAQNLFDVSTDDVVSRLKLVLKPYPVPSPQAKEDLKTRPDFYGPFWVATTAILFLAATGNFARLIETGDHTLFKADWSLVSLAAGTIYGCLIGVPLITRGIVFLSGEEVGSVNFLQLTCVCGYSLAPAIPASMLCLVPLGFLRWVIVLTGLGLSLLFVKENLLVDISTTVPWLKYVMMIAPCVMPVVVFIMYRVHFFTAVPVATGAVL